MSQQQLANATAAWVEAWLYGNARPTVVVDALARLSRQHADDATSLAIVERGKRVVLSNPFGSVQETFAS